MSWRLKTQISLHQPFIQPLFHIKADKGSEKKRVPRPCCTKCQSMFGFHTPRKTINLYSSPDWPQWLSQTWSIEHPFTFQPAQEETFKVLTKLAAVVCALQYLTVWKREPTETRKESVKHNIQVMKRRKEKLVTRFSLTLYPTVFDIWCVTVMRIFFLRSLPY